jgi:glycosyltransferase involved in cell wall biosynthesis
MLSLVVPVFKNQDSIPALLEAISGMGRSLDGQLEAVFVVDGSPDRCFEILRDSLPGCGFRSKLLLLTRNFGSFSAVRAGLEAASGERFAVMAADLQEPPELILEMDRVLREEPIDVAIGTREAREDPLSVRIPARIFWGFYRRYIVADMPRGGVDIFGCSREFRDALLALKESHSSLIAQVFWLGFRRKYLTYVRRRREHGVSSWTARKRINYLMDSVFSFSDLPIRLLIRVGAGGVALSVVLGLAVLLARFGGAIDVPGYTMTMVAILFFGALNLLGLGVVGSYAWRAYENTKQRPLNVVLSCSEFNVRHLEEKS